MRLSLSRCSLALALALCLPIASVQAADAAKVDELLKVMDLEANVTRMQGMMAQMIDQSVQQRLDKEQMSPDQRARVQGTNEVIKKYVNEMLSWKAMAPEYRAIYQEVLTNAEIDGAIAYYRTPAGASMMAKTPQLTQRTMEVAQRRAAELMPRIQAEIEQALKEAQAKADAAPAPAKAD